ncbi:MAG TPA: radical SAM protein [Puia sp.]|jgi:sulfatase maturation enzyme AslB (radical SAM superfamily)
MVTANTPSSLSPAHSTVPVSPDDASCFDRTPAPSPVRPQETLQQCRVSRIIQIHPTLRCNLFCKHCYSSSAPQKKEGLSSRALVNILEQATPLGYNVVSLSGGEPFLYSELEQLVTASRSLGYFNSVTTNGMLLRSQRAARILRQMDLVAVSVDGKQEAHDLMRGQQGAFTSMLEGLDILKDSIEKFGLIHTLLPDSWQILSWLTDFALEHKASLLHLHPLELSGRAIENFGDLHFTPTDLYRVYIAHYYLKTFAEPELFIQLDLLHRDNIIGNPNFFFHQSAPIARGTGTQSERSAKNFSSLFKELIINEAGDILPIAHGCSDFFRIGNINSGIPLEEMVGRFMEEKLDSIMQLYNDTYREILADTEFEIFNWSERVIENSHCVQLT